MKRFLNNLLLFGTFALLFGSCKKDEVKAVLTVPGSIPSFTSSASSVVLSNTNDSTTVVKFNWVSPWYGFNAVVSYTLYFDIPSDTSGANGWANAIKVTTAANASNQSYLGTDFNHIMNQLGLPFGSASTIVVRLKEDVNQSTGTASSIPTLNSVLTMSVTPYKVILIYPKLYVAGDFLTPNWTQIDQGGWILASVKSDGVYEGYVNFPAANNSFKLCTQTSWNGTNYGWGGTATTLSGAGSAGNCYFGGPGYCRVVADVNALTISYSPTNWFVSGDFNNWSKTANPLTFNATTNVWTATNVSMTAGTNFQFAGDPNYNNSFGADSKGNFVFKGGNIVVPKTGTYTVTLDLSHGAGNYSFSLK